ncbi:MAG: Minf_1886 family protein [Pirellulaceae bacterium]
MNDNLLPIFQLLQSDLRYQMQAYQFVQDSLAFAQEVLPQENPPPGEDPHLTGQELCEAIRLFAIDQFGYMSKTVLNNWGIHETRDFGEIVYNLIDIGLLRPSDKDEREHFTDVYSFEKAFVEDFQIRGQDPI